MVGEAARQLALFKSLVCFYISPDGDCVFSCYIITLVVVNVQVHNSVLEFLGCISDEQRGQDNKQIANIDN